MQRSLQLLESESSRFSRANSSRKLRRVRRLMIAYGSCLHFFSRQKRISILIKACQCCPLMCFSLCVFSSASVSGSNKHPYITLIFTGLRSPGPHPLPPLTRTRTTSPYPLQLPYLQAPSFSLSSVLRRSLFSTHVS